MHRALWASIARGSQHGNVQDCRRWGRRAFCWACGQAEEHKPDSGEAAQFSLSSSFRHDVVVANPLSCDAWSAAGVYMAAFDAPGGEIDVRCELRAGVISATAFVEAGSGPFICDKLSDLDQVCLSEQRFMLGFALAPCPSPSQRSRGFGRFPSQSGFQTVCEHERRGRHFGSCRWLAVQGCSLFSQRRGGDPDRGVRNRWRALVVGESSVVQDDGVAQAVG